MSPVMVKKSFIFRGKVQKVMFRQTFIRALLRRGLTGGASNDPSDPNLVKASVCGDEDTLNHLLNAIQSLPQLNSWGAKVEMFEELSSFIEIDGHQVTTSNVETFAWNPDVKFYL